MEEDMINEKQIHYLLTVAEEKNITAASRKLFISQPALSRLIIDLENKLGMQLFVRDRGSLHITQAGNIYLEGCREVLTIATSVHKRINDLNDSNFGKIVLGVTSITSEFLLPSILEPFENAFPNVELILMEERASELKKMVVNGSADMALIYQTDRLELDYQLVLNNSVFIQLPPAFYFDYCKKFGEHQNILLRPEDLSNQPMILLKRGRGLREIAERLFLQFNISPSRIIETDSIHLASTLVNLNKGFTFVPSITADQFAQDNRRCHFGEIENYPIERNLYCCYRKSKYLTKAEQFLIDLIPNRIARRSNK
jgi:LysR family cyn operon transcriptional activator